MRLVPLPLGKRSLVVLERLVGVNGIGRLLVLLRVAREFMPGAERDGNRLNRGLDVDADVSAGAVQLQLVAVIGTVFVGVVLLLLCRGGGGGAQCFASPARRRELPEQNVALLGAVVRPRSRIHAVGDGLLGSDRLHDEPHVVVIPLT